jgi:hypothetical protein
MTPFRPALAVAAVLSAATPAAAQSAVDVVRAIYDNPEAANAWRDGEAAALGDYAGAALETLLAHNRLAERDGYGCIDFDFVIAGQDYDADELARTLTLEDRTEGENATVWASFRQFGAPALVEWWLTLSEGRWQVTDVAGIGWTLSGINCDDETADVQ